MGNILFREIDFNTGMTRDNNGNKNQLLNNFKHQKKT